MLLFSSATSHLAWPPSSRKRCLTPLCVSSVLQFLRNPTKLQRNVFSWTIRSQSVSLFLFRCLSLFFIPWQGETVPSMQSQRAPPPKKHLRDTVSCEQTWLWSPPRIQTETWTKTLRGSDSGLILHVLTKWEGKPSRWRSGNRPKTLSVLPVLHTCLLSFFFVHTYIKAVCLKREIGGIEEVRLDLMPALAFDAHLDDTCERL